MPARYATKIDNEMMDILSRSTITTTTVVLPEQLSRDLYVKINKILVACGGKWNRSAKAHVFSTDPHDALGLAMDKGEVIDNAKKLQQFFTPDILAAYVVEMAGIKEGMRVLEPSAGAGAIAMQAAMRLGREGIIDCVEIDSVVLKQLIANLEKFNGFVTYTYEHRDFLDKTPVRWYHRVVMNPPFAVSADIEHVMHAHKFLIDGGKLVSIMAAGVRFREDKRTKEFREFVFRQGGNIESLPEESFKKSGTMVNTVLVTIPNKMS